MKLANLFSIFKRPKGFCCDCKFYLQEERPPWELRCASKPFIFVNYVSGRTSTTNSVCYLKNRFGQCKEFQPKEEQVND